MYRVLFIVSLVIKILMFRDAVKRGVPTHWFWIIAFVPLGEVIYYFVYPFDEGGLWRAARGWFKSPSKRYAEDPTLENKVAYARSLYEAQKYRDAETELEAILRHSEGQYEALYLLGMTRLQLEDFDGAIRPFTRLRDAKAGYRNYGGWLQLAFAHSEAGRKKEAIAELERLVERTGRLEHRVVLAEYLVKAGQNVKARGVLIRCRNLQADKKEWSERAARLLETLGDA